MDKNKDLLDHFLNNCPVEAKNYFENIISRLERIEKKYHRFNQITFHKILLLQLKRGLLIFD